MGRSKYRIGYGVTAALVALTLGGLAQSCKPRRAPTATLRSEGSESSTFMPDPISAAEAEKVRQACQGKSSLFRGTGAGDRVDFSTTEPAPWTDSPGSDRIQPDWFESARFRDRWTLSAAIPGASGGGECLRGSTSMTTEQLIAALGCGGAPKCTPSEDLCAQGTCLASVTEIDYSRTPRMIENGPVSSGGTVIALADQDPASKGRAATCVQGKGGWELKGSTGLMIGQPLDTEAHCQALARTGTEELVCGWSGTGVVPYLKRDGTPFGAPDTGAKSVAACAEMVRASSEQVVCGWTGQAVAVYAVTSPSRPIGGGEQSPDVQQCAAKVQTAFGGRVCSWDGKSIGIFDVRTGAADTEIGGFANYESCKGIIRETATAKGRADFIATRKQVSVPNPTPKVPAPGEPESGEGLHLAGGGWTWGDCNDSARAYHLVLQSGGEMVCQGKIDTVYSWGPVVKIDWLKGQPWSGRLTRDAKLAPIFTTQSPFATFGYGDVSIRFRLKSDVKFKFFEKTTAYDVCDGVSDEEVDDTVALRYWKSERRTGLDIILCSLGPVHSWSFGTRRHYDEMNREVTWMNDNDYRYYELYVKRAGVDEIYPDELDGHSFTSPEWKIHQNRHTEELPGQVFFNPRALTQTVEAHFSTDWSTYINP